MAWRRWTGGWAMSLAAIVVVLALEAGPAAAATPIDLGEADGSGPGLAITPGGSAALTYAVGGTLHYCRIDPGASGCSTSQVLSTGLPAFTEDSGNLPLIEGSTVRVLESRSESGVTEDKFLWSGEPFGSSTTLGTTSGVPASFLNFGEAVLAPAGTVNPANTVIAAVGTGASIAPTLNASGITAGSGPGSTFHITTDSTSDSTISLQGSMLSSAYIDQTLEDGVYWRRYTNPAGTPASIQTEANWSAPAKIGEAAGGGNQVRMATGPNGLYVAYLRPGDGALLLEHFNGAGFDPPVAVTAGGIIEFAISEDAGGLLHLAYRDSGGFHYRYSKDASNSNFSNPQSLPESATRGMRIATTADGNGWLSWWDNESHHDFALPLAPGEPAPPTPTDTTAKGKLPTTTTTKSVSLGHGLVGTLTVPKGCVPGGQVFKAKVAVKRKGSKAHKVSYTVKQVVFMLGKKKLAIDRRKPFEVSVPTTGLGAGKTLAVAARLSVNLHIGHRHSTLTKTLKASVKTCS
jgi:hypothetical protein